ncbi:MAG: hypothetical protein M3046_12190, partial [Actinomycetota bacterium]|nr:hypothetical protein [Actinomycetota bacterium]
MRRRRTFAALATGVAGVLTASAAHAQLLPPPPVLPPAPPLPTTPPVDVVVPGLGIEVHVPGQDPGGAAGVPGVPGGVPGVPGGVPGVPGGV